MGVLPQNMGGRIFQLSEYQKWEYQKPYLLDVFQANLNLFSKKVAMTDLKSENILYESYSCGNLASSICTDYEDKDKKLKELIDSLCKENPDH